VLKLNMFENASWQRNTRYVVYPFKFCFVCLFHLYPPVTRKRRWRYIWTNPTEFAACSKPPSRDNHRKAPYPRTQQRVRWGGCELNLHHAIVITRSP